MRTTLTETQVAKLGRGRDVRGKLLGRGGPPVRGRTVLRTQQRRAFPFRPRRPRSRGRRVLETAAAAIVARGANVGLMVLATPVVLSKLGPTGYGLWALLTSITFLLSFADFGIGSGLLNLLAKAAGSDDTATARAHVSSAFVMLLGAAAVMGLVVVGLDRAGAATLLARSAGPYAEELPRAALLLGLVSVAAVPAGLGARVQAALQEGARANAVQALGAVLAAIALVITALGAPSLTGLVLATAMPPVVVAAANTADVLLRSQGHLRPRLRLVTADGVRLLSAVGSVYFVLQVFTLVSYQVDAVVLSRLLGPVAVSEYSVATRIFSTVTTAVTLVALPLWPAFADALARGDTAWVRRTYRRALLVSLAVAVVLCGALLIATSWILKVWIDDAVTLSPSLLVLVALWNVGAAVAGPVVMVLNAFNQLRLQLLCAGAAAVVNVPLSIWATQRFGVAGVVFGSVAPFFGLVLLPYLLRAPALIARAHAVTASHAPEL